MIPAQSHCLFEEPYWLDAVAPNQWKAAELHQDGKLIGRLPYVIKKKLGLTSIGPTHYTNWLSPWVRPSGGKQASELSHQHQVLGELIKQLPRAEKSIISAAPEYTNMMAFHWAGFKLRFGYTHRLRVQEMSETQLWNGLRSQTRSAIRKAEKLVTIRTDCSVEDFTKVLLKTFGRQGINVDYAIEPLKRIDDVMKARGQRTIFSALDAEGNIHAAVYVVFDNRHTFYLAGGGDPAFRQSNGHALAMWSAILASRERAPVFDFVGSMVPNIEYFARGFGPIQVPRLMAEKFQGIGRLSQAWQSLRS
jgi:Acetyltransferase (GNAT) domain